MTVSYHWLLPLAFGLGAGWLYFGMLWQTVQRLLLHQFGALGFAGGFFLRVIMLLTGFYLVCGHNTAWWIACLVGWTLGRQAMLFRHRVGGEEVS